jgi:6-pyruvoyltetrahydropterin/6-carboxytetrahydropterin synthase
MDVWKRFSFEAAHLLPNVPAEHKCARLHGHSYQVEVRVEGPIGETSGWVRDFADLAVAWEPLHDALDHRYLNDIEGLANPTAEVLATWIWERLALVLPDLVEIEVAETCTAGCTYRGPDSD